MTAEVQGSRKRPYRVEVVLVRDSEGVLTHLRGWCACPVGHRCKHLAAVAARLLDGLAPEPDAADRSRDEMLRWAQGLAGRAGAANEDTSAPRSKRTLLYVIAPDEHAPPMVHAVAVAVGRSGYGRERSVDLDGDARSVRGWVSVDDQLLHHELRLRERGAYGYGHLFPRLPADETGPALLRRLVQTGRAHLGSAQGPMLTWARARRAEVGWLIDHRGRQRPALLGLSPGTVVLGLRPPHWVDLETGRCGPVHTDLSPAAAQAILHAPGLSAEAAADLDDEAWPSGSGVVPPRALTIQTLPACPPTPVLSLHGDSDGGWARLSWRYGEAVCDPDEPTEDASCVSEATTVLRVPRDLAAETALAGRLSQTGLTTHETLEPDAEGRWPSRWTFGELAPEDEEEAWLDFAATVVPQLTAEGWDVDRTAGFRWALSTVQGWYADVEAEEDGNWFALSMGVEIDGERVSVLPAVKRVLAQGGWDRIGERGVILDLGGGRRVRMPGERLRTIVSVLLELFGNRPFTGGDRVRLPRGAAGRLAELDATGDLRWYGPDRLRRLGERLADAAAQRLPEVAVPDTLRAELRAYQKTGLSWLQLLSELGVGGILADDMGLGKTVQALAHLVADQEAGRLDRPCLVVAPTSVLDVWCSEAARFAPTLSTLLYHGPRRAEQQGELARHDLVVTSYALLQRDIEILSAVDFHVAILDEAHAIKNPSAKVSAAARRLNARTRLCLTGTPLENRLEELWSLTDFVVPGLLGTARRFRRLFAQPIENDGDEARRVSLSRRLAPFLLRRTKEDVLPELPDKTEAVRWAELDGPQRDLYEAVRLGVEADVRRVIDDQGLGRSQIGVFEALLKLREVCCDPRLVPYPAARKVKGSAKLELLLSLLDELLGAGRRVLVFSQFTRMLDLVAAALDERGIAWCKLTGRTRKRAEVVERFQSGAVPVFLISLKAGGTGLNLTAADTVIHYDPWWNPAAQDQATDRAHRIGQTRPVLVLSLVARGTVEQRMLQLQASKRALSEGVLGPAAARGRRAGLGLDEADVEALLAPLPPR